MIVRGTTAWVIFRSVAGDTRSAGKSDWQLVFFCITGLLASLFFQLLVFWHDNQQCHCICMHRNTFNSAQFPEQKTFLELLKLPGSRRSLDVASNMFTCKK